MIMIYKKSITKIEEEVNTLLRNMIEGRENITKEYLDKLDFLIKKYKAEKEK